MSHVSSQFRLREIHPNEAFSHASSGKTSMKNPVEFHLDSGQATFQEKCKANDAGRTGKLSATQQMTQDCATV